MVMLKETGGNELSWSERESVRGYYEGRIIESAESIQCWLEQRGRWGASKQIEAVVKGVQAQLLDWSEPGDGSLDGPGDDVEGGPRVRVSLADGGPYVTEAAQEALRRGDLDGVVTLRL